LPRSSMTLRLSKNQPLELKIVSPKRSI
jgi:hypothetical protein